MTIDIFRVHMIFTLLYRVSSEMGLLLVQEPIDGPMEGIVPLTVQV